MENPPIIWNENVRLIISDVDETIAPVYEPADSEMIDELSILVEDGVKFLLVSGGGLDQINTRILDRIDPSLRREFIVGHCNGAETWGFTDEGHLRDEPYYSAYEDRFDLRQKRLWRATTEQLLGEFGLRRHATQPPRQFLQDVGTDPRDIMYEDRGPQITLEMINAYDMSQVQAEVLQKTVDFTYGNKRDLRPTVVSRANELFSQYDLPVSARLGGMFAVDLAVLGISKATAVRHTLDNRHVLQSIGLSSGILSMPESIEIWGDKFSKSNGGADSHLSEAVSSQIRSIDFRDEDPRDFVSGYNIVIWNGNRYLQDGLLEYLKMRH